MVSTSYLAQKAIAQTCAMRRESTNFFAKSVNIDISGFDFGVYIIKIRDNKNGIVIQRIVKQHSP